MEFVFVYSFIRIKLFVATKRGAQRPPEAGLHPFCRSTPRPRCEARGEVGVVMVGGVSPGQTGCYY